MTKSIQKDTSNCIDPSSFIEIFKENIHVRLIIDLFLIECVKKYMLC